MSIPVTHEEIDQEIERFQAKRQRIEQELNGQQQSSKIGFGSQGHFDKDLYAPAGSKYEGFVTSIGTNDDEDEDDSGTTPAHTQYHATEDLIQEAATAGEDYSYDPMKDYQKKKIYDRHDEYHMRQMRHMIISPARPDPFLEVYILLLDQCIVLC